MAGCSTGRWTLMAVLLALAGCAEPVRFSSDGAGGIAAESPGALYKPDGPGPFPAVVVLHGCGGVTGNQRAWARRLNRWGYVALVVDSFTPRGVQTVCTTPRVVPPELRARDAFAAAAWLREQPFVDRAHIGVVGFSHGGSTVLRAVLDPIVSTAAATPFGAAVAYYPGCTQDLASLATDTLILIGEADDWTPARRCTDYVAAHAGRSHPIDIKLYPGAYHGFDAAAGPRTVYGHYLVHDPAAAEDSFAMTRAFFDARLK